MNAPKKPAGGRRRPNKNTFVNKNGTPIKLNRSLSERLKAHREARVRRRAAYLSTLPKNRVQRILFRLRPKEFTRYWFSHDGGIMALKITGVGIVVCFAVIVGVFAYFRKDLPNIKDLSAQSLGGSITYYDRTGQTVLWQDYNAVKRQAIPGTQMSNNVRNATVAIEDKDFYKHGAFDVRGIARAAINDVLHSGSGRQGGSTISQQLVKLDQDWTAQRTIGNKIREVILAVELEREYSKSDILTGYLNAAPYGPVESGVEVAAQDYFNEDASQLSIAQAAMIASIPKAPSIYSPYGPAFDPQALLARQRYVIDQMAAQKMITPEQASQAKAVDVLAQVKPQQPSLYSGIKAPYFVLAAKDELETKYGDKTVQRGGWKVITTVDLKLQKLAEDRVAATLPIIQRQGGDDAAFVAIDNKTGQIVAEVGGVDFSNPTYGKLNFAHSVQVSPGSTFKPYDYSAFIDNNNAGAGSVLYDTQGAIPGYPCTHTERPNYLHPNDANCLWDYDFRYPGPLTLRYAIGGSRNVPAVKAMLSTVPNDTSPGRIASVNKTIATADAMMGNPNGYVCYDEGVDVFAATKSQQTQCYGSSAIGDGAYIHLDDHVTGLSTLARLGQQIPHTYILKIVDSSGKVVDQFKQPTPKQVIKPDTAYILDSMLSDPNASYLPASYKFQHYKGWDFAVKTGTTNSAFDGLMASWSTQYTALTWVGYHNRNRAMTGAMEYMTEPIVRGWMESAHDMLGMKPVNWTAPSDIKILPAFVIRDHVGIGSVEPSPSTDVFPSWYTPQKNGASSQVIDVVSGKAATSCTPDLAKKQQAGGNVNAFSVDVFVGAGSAASNTNATDDVHNCNGPNADTMPAITLSAPNGCSDTSDCIFTVAVTAGNNHPLSGGSYTAPPAGTVTLSVNGTVVDTINIPPDTGSLWNHTFTYQPTFSGSATVQVQVVDSVLYSGTDSAVVDFTPTTTTGGTNGTPIKPNTN